MAVQDRRSLTRSTLIHRIDNVELRVRDVDDALAFYRDVVGLVVLERDGTRAALGTPGGRPFVTVDSGGVTAPADATATGLFHVAIRFPERAALGDALARLRHARYEIGAGDHLVSEALYVDDPDGNGIELYWDRPEDRWPPPDGNMIVPMATLPVDLVGLSDEGRGEAAIGDPAPTGTDVGHVHLQVGDIDRTTPFYVEEVGLDLIAKLGAQAAFFSSNGYHHHIGANTWRSRGGRPAPSHRAGLARVAFEVSAPDELEALRARWRSRGRDLGAEEGRSLSVVDPDGVELHFHAR
jgi:catechol 2,3-dioxygenase